jgi:precorrin-6B methylase 2
MQKLWKKRNKVSKYRAKEAFKELDNKVEQSIEGENDDLSFEETFKPVNPVTITDL